ncbi:hypothetical protein ABPG72_004197 [Tetrahymena utriculariae]
MKVTIEYIEFIQSHSQKILDQVESSTFWYQLNSCFIVSDEISSNQYNKLENQLFSYIKMIRNIQKFADSLIPNSKSTLLQKLNKNTYFFTWKPNTQINQEEDDPNVSFSDLLKQEDEKKKKQKQIEENQKSFQQKYGNFDAKHIYMKTIKDKAKEKSLQDDEIVRHTKETFVYTNQDNPFYNAEAASIHSNMNAEEETIREWQYQFQKKNKRKPTLTEMQEDPTIGGILAKRRNQLNMLKAAVFKYKID